MRQDRAGVQGEYGQQGQGTVAEDQIGRHGTLGGQAPAQGPQALEQGLVCSRRSLLARQLGKGLDITENGQAMSAMRENEPGNHFLGTAHTLANFETAFYRSDTADNNSFEQWVEDGSLDASQRANRLWKERLAAYQPPALDDAMDAELQEYIAKRKAVLPDTFG